ncbi:MAG: translocation/assembly module TamB domain-containing protein, partial [Pseudomonadota bacterium]
NGRQLIVEALELRLEDHLWQSLTPLELDLAPPRISLRPFRLAHADESIELGGSLDDGQLLGVSVQASNIELGFLGRMLSLPHLVQGQADLKANLEGRLDDPSFQGNLTIKATSKQPQPFDLSRLTLNYARGNLHGEIHAHQDHREVLAVDLNLPADLALIAKPVEQRLLDAPLNLHLEIKRPELSGFQRAMPDLLRGLGYIEEAIEANLALKRPEFLRFSRDAAPPKPLPGSLVGTLEGTLDLQGSYAKVTLDTELRLLQLGILGIIEGFQGEADLQGEMELAPSVEALRQGLAEDRVEPVIRQLRLRSRQLKARLTDKKTVQDLELRDLLLLASAALKADGPWSEIKDLHGQLRFTGLPVTDLGLSARFTPEQLTLDHLKVKTAASELRGGGHMTLPGQQMQFRLDIPGLQLDEFVPGLATNLRSVVQGKIDIVGGALTPQIAARFEYAGADINADLALGLVDPALPSYRAELSIDGLDMARFSSDLQGLIQASLKFQGEGLEEVGRKASAVLNIDSDGFNLVPDLKVRLRGNVTGSEVELAEFKVQSVPVDFVAQGVLSADRQMALVYNMNLGDLGPLEAFLGVDLRATGGISGEITGSLEALRTQGTVYINDFHYAELKGEGLLGNFTADNLIASPQATLSVRVVGLQAPSLPRSSLQLEVNHHDPRGDISLSVTEGPYARSQLAGHIVYQQGLEFMIERMHLHSGDWIWKNPVPITVVYDDQGSLRLKDLQLENGEQRLSVEASLSKGDRISADVQLHDVQIRPAIHAFIPDADVPDGLLSLDLSVDGTLNEPGLQGSLLLSALQQQNQSLGEIRAHLSSVGTVLNSDLRWQDQNEQLLHLNGTVDTAAAGVLDLRLHSPGLDMSRLAALSKAITKSEGELSVDLRLAGTLAQPQAFGSLEIKNSQLQLAVTGENYTDIHSMVRFGGTRVDIESLHLGSQTGVADLVGWLEIAGFSLDQLDLSLKARDFTAMNTSAIGVRLSSDLSLRGSLHEMTAKGDIDIQRARIRLDNLPTSEAHDVEPWELTVEGVYGPGPEEIERINGKLSGPIKKDPLPFLRADIDVDIPRNAWVQGEGTAVEMKGELQLRKDLAGPFVIGGYVETLRGFASFLGKKFEIEKGRVTFTGTEEINPNLAITAIYKVSDYIVYVDVTGESKKPEINFRSEPELEEADVISLLIFGRTTDRLSSSEQNTLSSEAGQLAGSMAAGMLERTLGNTFGLDTIAVDLGDADTGGSVGAGRYITQDIYLSYERTIRDPTKENRSGNTVGIEYSINDRLKMKGTSSDIGETALDFNWGFDY